MTKFNISLKERVILVDILATFFGISSWVEVNGLWVQTPILVQTLPEEWKLTSYIIILTQLANIGPIVYSILKSKVSLKSIESPFIHITLFLGAISCLFLSLFWDRISDINGSKYSVTFLALTALLAVVDCTTNVLYLPFMAHFKSKYLMSYIFGQNLSSLIPSLIALIQGAGGDPQCVTSTTSDNTTVIVPQYPEPRFSVSVFFIFLCCLVLMSWLAFILLNHLKSCQSERVFTKVTEEVVRLKPVSTGIEGDLSQSTEFNSFETKTNDLSESNEQNISKKTFISLLITQSYVCALSIGVLPSIQSYSCMPYGSTVYHLIVTLNGIAAPIACFLAFFIRLRVLRRSLPIVVCLGSVCAVYIIVISLFSPNPPLQHSIYGKILISFTWIAFTSLIIYSRACIASILRNTSTGHKSLFYCGVFTQIGSTFGAIFIFIIINTTDIFVASYPCS